MFILKAINDNSSVACSLIIDCSCDEDEVSKRGIIEVDPETKRVLSFVEKPQPTETASRLQSPCFYLLHRDHLRHLEMFLADKHDRPVHEKDATGHFLR